MESFDQANVTEKERHTHFDESSIIVESHMEASAPTKDEEICERLTPICVICKHDNATYQPDSCQCAFSYCKKCAMKCATGGKCKICKAFFGGLKLSHI